MERLLTERAIRPGRAGDLDALERLENAVFDTDRLSRRSLRYFLGAATTDTLVAEDAAGLTGYAMIGFRAGSGIGRIFSLAVDRRSVRRGVGGDLLRACEAAARARGRRQLRLEVRTDNAAAVALYKREGYARLGVTEDYYEDGASALRLGKPLAPDPAPRGIQG